MGLVVAERGGRGARGERGGRGERGVAACTPLGFPKPRPVGCVYLRPPAHVTFCEWWVLAYPVSLGFGQEDASSVSHLFLVKSFLIKSTFLERSKLG